MSYLYNSDEWTFQRIEKVWNCIDKIAKEEFGLDYYEPQIEVIDYDQFLAISQSNGMPYDYPHWSKGRSYLINRSEYVTNKRGNAYEVIINSDPAICYISETNTMTQQLLVLAHAAVGHSSFFKNNFLFKEHTNPRYNIPLFQAMHNYILECEKNYGEYDVEELLDFIHPLGMHSIDRNRRHRVTEEKQLQRLIAHNDFKEQIYNETYSHLIKDDEYNRPSMFPEENLLYFIEKYSPTLDQWQREIIRLYRKTQQYFYPQILTKMMNEGYASFWEKEIIDYMYKHKFITEGAYLEFLVDHTNVGYQQYALNPYGIGCKLFTHIKEETINPTKASEWLNLESKDWLVNIDTAMRNYKDESFVTQYLSDKFIDNEKMWVLEDDLELPYMEVTQIASNPEEVREELTKYYSFSERIPTVVISEYDSLLNDLTIEIRRTNKTVDQGDVEEITQWIANLMGGGVQVIYDDGELISEVE